MMSFTPTDAFSGFAVDNLAEAKVFYTDILGLDVEDEGAGLRIHLPDGGMVFIYHKEVHEPATFTILNFVVDDIDAAVESIKRRGITFEHYAGIPADEKGILRRQTINMGPDIAWFKDPAGNTLAVIGDA